MSKTTHDLVIQGGRLIDPAQSIDGIFDVGVRDARIAAIQPHIEVQPPTRCIDARGKLVTPGVIDHHLHCCDHFTEFGIDPDRVGIEIGVSAIVDQGTMGSSTFYGFKLFIVKHALTDIFCYLSPHMGGDPQGRHVDFHGPDSINRNGTFKVCLENRDVIRGIKAHAELGVYSRWGTETLEMAKEIARAVDLPLEVHIGTLFPVAKNPSDSPDDVLKACLPFLDKGDIIIHPFTGNPGGILDKNGRAKPEVREAYDRGVLLDVAHGTHFNLDVARRGLEQGLKPHIISSDSHHDTHGDIFIPWGEKHLAYSLWGVIAKMMALGLTLEEVLPMITINPAAQLRQEDRLGSLRVGMPAEVSILELETGEWALRDARNNAINATCRLVPRLVIKRGKVYEVDMNRIPEFAERPVLAKAS